MIYVTTKGVSDSQNQYLKTLYCPSICLRDLTPVSCFTHIACVTPRLMAQ